LFFFLFFLAATATSLEEMEYIDKVKDLAVANPYAVTAAIGVVGLYLFLKRRPILFRSGGIVISGASTGIGKATALKLAARGFYVFAGVRKPADGEALVKESGGKNLEYVILDVTSDQSVKVLSNCFLSFYLPTFSNTLFFFFWGLSHHRRRLLTCKIDSRS
jgi:hypothetical protein